MFNAQKITKEEKPVPGVYLIDNASYHGGPGISSSHIKEILKSPLHYKNWLQSEKKTNDEMIIGKAVHALVLEPETFKNEFIFAPKLDRRTKEGKEKFALFEKEAAGKCVIPSELADTIRNVVGVIQEKLLGDQQLSKLLQGMKEYSFYWNDPDTGLLCKARPDILTPFGVISDLKIVKDAGEKEFQNTIARYGYFIQAAFYLDGIKEVLRKQGIDFQIPDSFVLIAIERERPNGIGIYPLSDAAIDFGRQLYKKALRTYKQCLETNQWPGYTVDLDRPIELPNWVYYAY